jgi:beta-lactamase class A
VTGVLLALVLEFGPRADAQRVARLAASPASRFAECDVPGTDKTIDQLWRPDVRSATGYARTRVGDIAFAVRTDDRFYGYRPDHVEWSASVVKAMMMVAYLDEPRVADRPIDAADNALLIPMITWSDNNAADQVDEIVGSSGLDGLAQRVGMTQFVAAAPIWGESQITASDQTRFFLHIDSYIVPRHRAYAMHLLASVIPAERWGIGELPQNGWTLYFKGGWGYGTGLLDHQVVLLKRGCARLAIAVLTMYDGSHAYGKQTLYGIFQRLLQGFPTHWRHRRTTRRPATPRTVSRSLAVKPRQRLESSAPIGGCGVHSDSGCEGRRRVRDLAKRQMAGLRPRAAARWRTER